MDATQAQRDKVSYLRSVFGKDTVKSHTPARDTGVMWVEVRCQAGVWDWHFDTMGTLVGASLRGRLFQPPAPEHRPSSAIDN